MYEIITGRRTLERMKPLAEQKLLEWVREYPVDSKRFKKIIDPKLCNKYHLPMVRRVAKLADHCVNKIDKKRPTMAFVVESLTKIIEEVTSEDMGTSDSVGKSTS